MWAALLCLTLLQDPADADHPVRLTLSGEIEFDFVYRNGSLNETAFWTPGGLPGALTADDGESFIAPRLRLRIDAELSPLISATVELGNRRIDFDSFNIALQNDRLGDDTLVSVIQAFVSVRDWPFEGIEWHAGTRRAVWDPVGGGHPFFLDLGGSESAWDELPDSTAPPFPLAGTNTVPQTRRDELQPVGLFVRWTRGDFTLDVLVLPAVIERGRAIDDEAVYGATAALALGDFRVSALALLLVGGTPLPGTNAGGQEVWTLGGAVAARFFGDHLSLAAEAYFQFGEASEDLDAKGAAFRISARGSLDLTWTPWLELSYTWVSGDDRGTDDEEGRFLSYENNDRSPLVEGNEFGLDLDSNYGSFRVAGGFSLHPFESHGPIEVWLAGAFFDLVEEIPVEPDPAFGITGRSDGMGTELDVGGRFAWSKALSLDVTYSFLFGSDVMEIMTHDASDQAHLFTFGARLRF